MTSVSFKNVGRGKQSWITQISGEVFEQMEHAVIKSGALMSQDIDFSENDDGSGGTILAGCRPVGTYEIVEGHA